VITVKSISLFNKLIRADSSASNAVVPSQGSRTPGVRNAIFRGGPKCDFTGWEFVCFWM